MAELICAFGCICQDAKKVLLQYPEAATKGVSKISYNSQESTYAGVFF